MNQLNIIKVRDVMKTEYDTVDGTATIQEALDGMQHIVNKCFIVKKRDEHDEFGLLLISDIGRHVLGKNRSPDRVNVYEIMQKPLICVHPGMNIRYCARLLDRFQLTRVPVIDQGTVVGIVSFTDLVLRGMRAATVADQE